MRKSSEVNLDKLFREIKGLARPTCFASTAWLAERVGLSERQTYRYLKTLAERNMISIQTTRRYNPALGRITSRRVISLSGNHKSSNTGDLTVRSPKRAVTPLPSGQSGSSPGSPTISTAKPNTKVNKSLRTEMTTKPTREIPSDIREEHREMAKFLVSIGASPEAISEWQRMEDRDRDRKSQGLPTFNSYNYNSRKTMEFY